MKKLLIIAAGAAICGCVPQKRIYKVDFADGTYDYFELDYKPKDDATSIVYDGEVILGVERLERVK